MGSLQSERQLVNSGEEKVQVEQQKLENGDCLKLMESDLKTDLGRLQRIRRKLLRVPKENQSAKCGGLP
jgi:hypothetical protein